MRNLLTYTKVQRLLSVLIRNRAWAQRYRSAISGDYLNLGCGSNPSQGFINIDFFWRPGVNLCWDLMHPLPFPDHSIQGIFSEHVFEHFSVCEVAGILEESFRVIKSGGRIRIIVPDVELYARRYVSILDGVKIDFPYRNESWKGLNIPVLSLARPFYMGHEEASRTAWAHHGHRTGFDYSLLSLMLVQAGFTCVSRMSFGHTLDPMLNRDLEERACESLYVEAVKP